MPFHKYIYAVLLRYIILCFKTLRRLIKHKHQQANSSIKCTQDEQIEQNLYILNLLNCQFSRIDEIQSNIQGLGLSNCTLPQKISISKPKMILLRDFIKVNWGRGAV